MYYIGIDGGGTKTGFTIINNKGHILNSIVRGTCHFQQVGYDNLKIVIEEGIKDLINEVNIDLKDVKHVFLGIPGFGETKEVTNKIPEIVKEILHEVRFTCGNDVESCWAGALLCEPGLALIAGTGSIVYGVDQYKNTARSGGWGYFIGDEGSAFWIAKKVLEIFSKQSDNRLEKTSLYRIVKEKEQFDNDFDVINKVYYEYKMSRSKIAQFSKYAYLAAEENDKYAIKIFEDAAYQHYLMFKSVYEELDFESVVKASYSGGVFKAGKYILEPLKEILSMKLPNVKLEPPQVEPVIGSAIYAYLLDGNTITNDFIKNIKSTE